MSFWRSVNLTGNQTDVLRYTYQLQTASFAEEFARIRAALEKAGYTVVKVKNTLKDAGVAYRGVNCQFETPDSFKFELQSHTPESLALKENELHKLYEEARLPGTDPKRRAELVRRMIELSDGLATPPNIEEVRK